MSLNLPREFTPSLSRGHFFPDGDSFLNVDGLGQIARLAGVVGGGESRAVTAFGGVGVGGVLQSGSAGVAEQPAPGCGTRRVKYRGIGKLDRFADRRIGRN
ncbi:MAG: hypothetical protein UU83_C0040G0001, partial [Candidatus Jorgensenbacteria bacterium GW2011_GWF2_41_8]